MQILEDLTIFRCIYLYYFLFGLVSMATILCMCADAVVLYALYFLH